MGKVHQALWLAKREAGGGRVWVLPRGGGQLLAPGVHLLHLPAPGSWQLTPSSHMYSTYIHDFCTDSQGSLYLFFVLAVCTLALW